MNKTLPQVWNVTEDKERYKTTLFWGPRTDIVNVSQHCKDIHPFKTQKQHILMLSGETRACNFQKTAVLPSRVYLPIKIFLHALFVTSSTLDACQTMNSGKWLNIFLATWRFRSLVKCLLMRQDFGKTKTHNYWWSKMIMFFPQCKRLKLMLGSKCNIPGYLKSATVQPVHYKLIKFNQSVMTELL